MLNKANLNKKVIAMLGAPHSGKSVFVAELYRQALINPAIGSQKVFLQRTCPDGEGMWSAESDQEIVNRIREKGSFTPEVVNFYLNSIDGLQKTKDLVLIDCGGLKSLENILILGHSSDSIILSSSEEKMNQWTQFCNNLDQIINAVQKENIELLTELQLKKIIEIIPENKMAKFEETKELKQEIENRLSILYENFTPAIEKLIPHNINLLAQLKSRLLTPEQRAELDQDIEKEITPPTELFSCINRESIPWQGEILDLDRERPNFTYQNAIRDITNGISELIGENIHEGTQEIQSEFRPGQIK